MGLPFQRRARRLEVAEEEEVRAINRQRWEAWLLEDEPRIQAHWREVDKFLNRPSYGVPASKMAILGLYMPRWCDLIREEHRCAICLEDMEPRHKFRMMPCYHSFHQLCIFNWLQINRLCPVCQFALPSEEEEQRLSDEQAARSSCKMEAQEANNP
ncbi:Zinc finger, C3HC4 type family protein, expressed [Panicum miliaceum]|uniref:Zinc finger, C3HC4 type family protein, expressed n=1 Tax=Panicum miliaceum TaxID=4540 RepID=A0A3L6Q5C1_PANMI|nr:Zinc finger, C3HC4 type family protein, expressed [Panicum miliaceum]